MDRQQLNVRLTDRMSQILDELVEYAGSKTSAVTMALARLHQEEIAEFPPPWTARMSSRTKAQLRELSLWYRSPTAALAVAVDLLHRRHVGGAAPVEFCKDKYADAYDVLYAGHLIGSIRQEAVTPYNGLHWKVWVPGLLAGRYYGTYEEARSAIEEYYAISPEA